MRHTDRCLSSHVNQAFLILPCHEVGCRACPELVERERLIIILVQMRMARGFRISSPSYGLWFWTGAPGKWALLLAPRVLRLNQMRDQE